MIGFRAEQTIASIRKSGFRQTLNLVQRNLKKEGGAQVPISERIWLIGNGFKQISYVLYGFSGKDRKARANYLSDRGLIILNCLNGEAGRFLQNKLVFHRLLEKVPCGCKVPKLQALIRRQLLISASPPHQETSLAAILERTNALFVKPIGAGRGHGVRLVVREGASSDLISNAISDAKYDEMIVVDRVEQASCSARISPDSFNTVRVVSIRVPKTREIFIPAAVHRIGTRETAPLDNFSQGGLSCAINVATGRLGPGIRHPSRTGWKLQSFSAHPDTGIKLDGQVIPHWQKLLANVKELMEIFPDLEFAAWDMLPVDDGWCVIEGNHMMDVDLLQVHGGLLADERVRQFIAYHCPAALGATNR